MKTMTIYQIVLDGSGTIHNYSPEDKDKLVNKIVELQVEFPESVITFLRIEL